MIETLTSPVVVDVVDYFTTATIGTPGKEREVHEHVGLGYLMSDGTNGLILNGRLSHSRHQVDSWYRWKRYLDRYASQVFSTHGLASTVEDFETWVSMLTHTERNHAYLNRLEAVPHRVADHAYWLDAQGYTLSEGWSMWPPRPVTA